MDAAFKENDKMIWTIILVLLALWVLGFVAGVGGSLIHLLLVVAAVVFLVRLFTGGRSMVA